MPVMKRYASLSWRVLPGLFLLLSGGFCRRSVFDFLPNNCGIQIAYGITEIVPHICGAELAELLQMDPQAAILQLNDTYFTEDNIPVMASWISVKDPIVRFRAIRRQLSAS